MIGLRLSVPIACWRKGHARELLETEDLPPPATCYGALLSLVGETDRDRHRGCRVTAGILKEPERGVVLRKVWRIKDARKLQGEGNNATLDFQQLVLNADLVIWCDSREESSASETLEERVKRAMLDPASIDRFGGWSLGESTHLINDAALLDGNSSTKAALVFLTDPNGTRTMPVWVDHVGSAGTRYATGRIEPLEGMPPFERLPTIPMAEGR